MAYEYAKFLDQAAIRTATIAARDGDKADAPAQTTEQQIADLIEADFGCHKAQVRKLVELLGHRLPQPSARGMNGVPVPGALVSHNRELDVITHHDCDGDGVKMRGGYINGGERWSYATDAELDRFFAA